MFEIVRYKKNKTDRPNAKAGIFDVKIPKWGGFIIRECVHFIKGEAHWFAFPSRSYEENGVTKYFELNQFDTPEMKKAFSEKVVAALKDYLLHNPDGTQ